MHVNIFQVIADANDELKTAQEACAEVLKTIEERTSWAVCSTTSLGTLTRYTHIDL